MHAGASKLRDVLLPACYEQVQAAPIAKIEEMCERGMAPNITCTCDNWSTAMMLSVLGHGNLQ